MSEEKEIVGYFIAWGTLMTMLTGLIAFVSGKQTDKKISEYDEKRKKEEKEEESETLTLIRGVSSQLTEMDKNTSNAHTEIKTEIIGINEKLDGQQENITKLFDRTEEQGNRITAVETKQENGQ